MWISFVGFMASGKTSVARRIAREASLPLLDLDELVEERAGRPIPEIFAAGGVEDFRRIEREALEGVTSAGDLLLATGGGAVEQEANVARLRDNGRVIWLDAAWEALRRRLGKTDPHRRPMIGHLGWDGMRALYLRRNPLYAAAAHYRFDTGGVGVDEVAKVVAPVVAADLKRAVDKEGEA